MINILSPADRLWWKRNLFNKPIFMKPLPKRLNMFHFGEMGRPFGYTCTHQRVLFDVRFSRWPENRLQTCRGVPQDSVQTWSEVEVGLLGSRGLSSCSAPMMHQSMPSTNRAAWPWWWRRRAESACLVKTGMMHCLLCALPRQSPCVVVCLFDDVAMYV